MDLSKRQKTRRDTVESPLFRLEKLLDELEEIHTRNDATIKVWPETGRTLRPALTKLNGMRGELAQLKDELSRLWQAGFERKWK